MKITLAPGRAMSCCLLFFFTLIPHVHAQSSQHDWETLFQQLCTQEDAESDTWEQAFDHLSELAEHPFNINTATREQLEELPFLSAQQVEDICYWLYRYAPMRSMGELAMIETLDPLRRELLSCFVYLGDAEKTTEAFSLAKLLRGGKHDVLFTAKVPFYERQGDKNGYLGYPYRHTTRYQFSNGQRLKMGLVGAQDAGEPFLAHRNKAGYDFYSFYFLARGMGRVKTLVLGRYRLKMGMGLVVNNDFMLGKLASLATLGRNSQRLSAHSSRSESNYLQGAAATLALTGNLDLNLFASCRQIDATLNKDDGSVATILKSGYHRTQSEMDRRNNTTQTLGGANLRWQGGGLHVGLTAMGMALSRTLSPDDGTLYRRYWPRGRRFWNASVDYGYQNHRIVVSGETATGDSHAWATLNTLSCRLTDRLDALVVQRFYSYRYYALLARSFSDGGSVQNESGLYAGLTWRPVPRWSLQAYADYAHYAWARYGVSRPSHAWDAMTIMAYRQKQFSLTARLRVRQRQKDNEDKTALESRWEQRARLAADYEGRQWSTRTQADMAHVGSEQGWMVSQNVGVRLGRQWRLNALVAWFKTDGNDARIYTYERGMLHAYSFPSFAGHGMRWALLGRADLSKRLMLMGKLSTTHYFDRHVIGSSLQQINSSSMTNLEMQLKWRF